MMRRTRAPDPAPRAPLPASSTRALTRFFSLLFALLTNACARRRELATFWGPSVRYGPNTTSLAHRSARRGNATELILRNQNSEERTHEEAYCSHCPGCHRH